MPVFNLLIGAFAILFLARMKRTIVAMTMVSFVVITMMLMQTRCFIQLLTDHFLLQVATQL